MPLADRPIDRTLIRSEPLVRICLILTIPWGLLSGTAAFGQPVDPLEATGRTIIGYADQISVTGGDSVRFHVSTTAERYRAQLVRLIHGDQSPRGPGYEEDEVDAEFNGSHAGQVQTWNAGSYVRVPDRPPLDLSGSFTIQAWVYPTTPEKGVQGLVTKWDPREGGYGLFVGEGGRLALWIDDGKGPIEKVRTEHPLYDPEPMNGAYHANNWYFVAATYNAETETIRLYKEPLTRWPRRKTGERVRDSVSSGVIGEHDGPLLIGAYRRSFEEAGPMVAGNFNGKIDRPRIFDRALTPDQLKALRNGVSPDEPGFGLVAGWTFHERMRSTRIVDGSTHGLNGRTVHMPMRGMTGYNWSGDVNSFLRAPEQYGAIYFHEDDLEDAHWRTSLAFEVPDRLRSGIYAARVRTKGGGEDYLPFVVRPGLEAKTADIAFLVPTFTYLAYANIGNACEACSDMPANGLYHRHSDGSGVAFATRRQPILDMRPKVVTRWGAGGSTPRHLSGDLYMIDWLEKKGFEYEVISDHALHREGESLLEEYNVVVTGSHPEYLSETMYESMERYLREGGRLMYLGGNGFYWVTGVPKNRPYMIEVRRWGGTQAWAAAPGERYQVSDGKLGGLWRNRGRPPQELVGVGFAAQGFDRNIAYARKEGSRNPRAEFIFEGLASVDSIGAFPSLGMGYGEAGDEVDRLDFSLGTPPHTLLLGRASDFSNAYQLVREDVLQMSSGFGGNHPLVRSDIVFFEYPREGAVFSVGSMSWMEGLSAGGYRNSVSRITENVLSTFAKDGSLPD